MNHKIQRASSHEIKQVIRMMLSEASSDPTGMAELKRNWWQRVFYQYLVAPRMLRNQMDTYVATGDQGLLGYLVIQYTGTVAGTFDWAILPSVPEEDRNEVLADLVDAVLDRVEEQQHYSHFFFGMMARLQHVVPVLEELGFYLLDYQLTQLVSDLPLPETTTEPENLVISAQIPARFQPQMPALIALDYPNDGPAINAAVDAVADPETVIAMHSAVLGGARLLSIEHQGKTVGMIQQTRWRDELRILYSLDPELWNSPLERQLIGDLPGFLGRRAEKIRLRSFSQVHLATSRPGLEPLGLQWEKSPWHRWLVAF